MKYNLNPKFLRILKKYNVYYVQNILEYYCLILFLYEHNALENYITERMHYMEHLDIYSHDIFHPLNSAFAWSNTQQGFWYWEKLSDLFIHHKLNKNEQ